MGYFQRCHDELAPLERKVREHEFIGLILNKRGLTKSYYAAYLRETYHLVRQTPLYLAAGAASCGSDPKLRDWFLNFAVEEKGHDLLCVHDIRKLGADPEALLRRHPDFGAWWMISQNHYLARVANPAGIVGFAAATEGLGASLAQGVGSLLEEVFPFTRGATSFLKVHGHEDQQHIAFVKEMFERCASDADTRELMKTIWRATLFAYLQLFSDVMAQGPAWLQGESPGSAG